MKKEKLTETIFKVIYDTNNLNATNPFYGAGRGRGGGAANSNTRGGTKMQVKNNEEDFRDINFHLFWSCM